MKRAVQQAVRAPARDSAKVVEAPSSVEVFGDVEQQTEEWRALRCGILTASEFGKLMVKTDEREGRRKLMLRLAGEVLTGEPAETFQNGAMLRGIEMEPAAREHYLFTRGVELVRVGFVRRRLPRKFGGEIIIGCSPDSLINDDGALEIKTMNPAALIELAERTVPPNDHRAQCQGTLLVTGRRYVDLKFYYSRMPVSPTFRIMRDEPYIRELTERIEVFDYELRTLVDKIRSMGGKGMTPQDFIGA